jgi:hypothetical protein
MGFLPDGVEGVPHPNERKPQITANATSFLIEVLSPFREPLLLNMTQDTIACGTPFKMRSDSVYSQIIS